MRQRGTVYFPGENVREYCNGCLCLVSQRWNVTQVGMGRDHTLFSLVEGHVYFFCEARRPLPPKRGYRKPYKKYLNVKEVLNEKKLVLTSIVE